MKPPTFGLSIEFGLIYNYVKYWEESSPCSPQNPIFCSGLTPNRWRPREMIKCPTTFRTSPVITTAWAPSPRGAEKWKGALRNQSDVCHKKKLTHPISHKEWWGRLAKEKKSSSAREMWKIICRLWVLWRALQLPWHREWRWYLVWTRRYTLGSPQTGNATRDLGW